MEKWTICLTLSLFKVDTVLWSVYLSDLRHFGFYVSPWVQLESKIWFIAKTKTITYAFSLLLTERARWRVKLSLAFFWNACLVWLCASWLHYLKFCRIKCANETNPVVCVIWYLAGTFLFIGTYMLFRVNHGHMYTFTWIDFA